MPGCLGYRGIVQQLRIGGVEGDAAGVLGLGAGGFLPGPHHIPGGEQFVQHGGLVAAHPSREHRALPHRQRQGHTLQLFDDTHQPVRAVIPFAADRTYPLTVQQQRLIDRRRHRFDGLTRLAQRACADAAEHIAMQILNGPMVIRHLNIWTHAADKLAHAAIRFRTFTRLCIIDG